MFLKNPQAVMVDSTQGHKWTVKPIQLLATLVDSCTVTLFMQTSKDKFSNLEFAKKKKFSNLVMLYLFPMVILLKVLLLYAYASMGFSVLPSLESKIIQSHDMQLKLQRISIYLSNTLTLVQPILDADIPFSLPRSPAGIPESPDR
jgi:hypothetical protein